MGSAKIRHRRRRRAKRTHLFESLFERRAREKQEARQRDAGDLASGAKTPEQLQRENSFIRAEWGLVVDYGKAPVAG